MRMRQPIIVGVVLLGLAVTAGLGVRMVMGRMVAVREAATYYCPMHPTYTSDRPGDCPICNMRLVKRDAAAPSEVTTQEDHTGASKQFTSICYLHNCSKLHEGKPCPMTVVAKPGEAVTCPICGTHIAEAAGPPIQRKLLYWTDPMIPDYRAEGPGKSPMGMDLVPVYEEETPMVSSAAPEGHAPVLLTSAKQQLIGVRTAPAERQRVLKTIRTVGTIAHDPELYQAQAELIQASQAWRRAQAGSNSEVLAQAERLLDSSRLRLRHLGLGDEAIRDVETWTEPDSRLLVGGTGAYWVYASIYEYELSLVQPGATAVIEVEAFPGRAFSGTVRSIDPMLDPVTRTARARILVEDPEGILKPAMFVTAVMTVDLGEQLTVPVEAVFATGERKLIFVDRGQGLFEPRDVVLGIKADDVYAVESGVTEGEQVVTSGNFLIDSESRLKAALQGMTPPPARSPAGPAPDGAAPPSAEPAGGGASPGGHQHGQ